MLSHFGQTSWLLSLSVIFFHSKVDLSDVEGNHHSAWLNQQVVSNGNQMDDPQSEDENKQSRGFGIMTTQARTPDHRALSPIFTATIVPGAVSRRTGVIGKYLVSKKSTYVTAKMDAPREITLMALGKSYDAVQKHLRNGEPVDLAVRFEGGTLTLKAMGLPGEDNSVG